jgi:hypothetical protein
MRAIEILSYASCCIAIVACGGSVEPDPTGTSAVEGPLSLSETCDGGSGGSSFFACNVDSDCVAVSLVERCCYNGWKIAVAKDEVAAYEKSNVCTLSPKERICPMYIVLDRRVPACNETTRECEMVAPSPGTTEPSDPARF